MRRWVGAMAVATVVTGSFVGVASSEASVASVGYIVRDGMVLQYERVAHSPSPVSGEGATISDFDGDGIDDIAAAAQPINSGPFPYPEAGVVAVRYSSAPARDYFVGASLPGSDVCSCLDSALAAGDFNADGFDDLVIGDYAERLAVNSIGGVWIIPGAADGLQIQQAKHLTQDSPGVPGTAEVLDWFGASVATGDIDGDGYDDLAIGSPGEAIGSTEAAGSVLGIRVITQDSAGVPGAPETDDGFGRSVSAGDVNGDGRGDVLVGVPGEDIGSSVDAGSVTLLFGSVSGLTGKCARF